MDSVFIVSPPSFTIKEISDFLDIEFSMNGTVTELYSDRDQNFHFSNGQDDLIIKVSNPAEERSILDLQDLASKHIADKDPTIQIPKLVGRILEIKKDGKTFLVRLMSYVKGQFLGQNEVKNSDMGSLGDFLGRLSLSLEGFDHPGAHRQFEWDCKQRDMIKDISGHIESNRDKKTVTHFLNEFEKNIPGLAVDMRMSVIHNDCNDHNILISDNGDIIGIIDFGDMVYTFQAVEPAVAMAYIALKNDDPFPAIASMLKGYHAKFPLQQSELASTIYLMCSRLCITVSMAAWRKKLFPDNKYLTISESSAWTLLRMMEEEDMGEWSSRLVEHAS